MYKKAVSFFLFAFSTSCSFNVYSLESSLNKEFSIEDFQDDFSIIPLSESIHNNMGIDNLIRAQNHIHHHWYNVHSSDERKFVWFRVFKVASGTIRGILRSQVSDLTQSRPTSIPSKFTHYFKFAFVRNPWDRILSCYFHKIVTKKAREFEECFGKDFEYFVNFISKLDMTKANPHIKLQTRLIPVEQCDFIGKVDNFVNDLKYVCDVIGIEMVELGYKHKTEHAHYSTYYNARTQRIIADLYKEDIETFGFTFETE